jgi:hypothetical protein
MKYLSLLPLLYVLLLYGCRSESRTQKAKESQETASTTSDDPADAVRKAMESITGGGSKEKTVDHRALRDLLKEEVRNYSRTEYASQSSGVYGINISNAEAEYESSGGKRIKATITDTGGVGAAFMSMAAWSSLQIDREDRNGWERTGTFKGYKSFEKYTKGNNSSELSLIIENRFIVNLNGQQCDMDDLKKFADDLNLDRLKKLI